MRTDIFATGVSIRCLPASFADSRVPYTHTTVVRDYTESEQVMADRVWRAASELLAIDPEDVLSCTHMTFHLPPRLQDEGYWGGAS